MASSNSQIDLIAGLGNPGSEYTETRHNAGFRFVDRVANAHSGTFLHESRFLGDACSVNIAGRVVRLLKPMTFMNRSGQPVAAMARYFKIPVENILIVHDELDLPAGDARIKSAGGHGGHNGLRDLINHFGSNNFWRLRLGIGHPGYQSEVTNYVLKPPSREDTEKMDEAMQAVIEALPMVVNDQMQKAINKVHAHRRKIKQAVRNDTQRSDDGV